MNLPDEAATIGEALFSAADRHGMLALLAVPANPARDYDPQGRELNFGEVAVEVRRLMDVYSAAGYGLDHRIGLLLENRLEHILHKLAMNALGATCVPINSDYQRDELVFLIDHARLELIVILPMHADDVNAALAVTTCHPATVTLEDFDCILPAARSPAAIGRPTAATPASILYTSGTTGRPKGCVLSHRYELAAGAAYAAQGGLAKLEEGHERIYNPLPLHHVNSSVLCFFGSLLTGNCHVQSNRFSPKHWWNEIRASRATVVHYLGVITQLLMAQVPGPEDRDHQVRFGFGAGVDPQIHAPFEARFGFPLVELWGMTEMVRVLADKDAPRSIGTRAFGRAVPGVDVRVVDDQSADVPDGTSGEMLIRHSEATPRKDFFNGYLNDVAATETAWRGGWFHTGDVVTRDTTGMLHFVERRKNIIRRAGENIAAAEIEALLLTHPSVLNAAVLAVPDPVREEEVMACVVLRNGKTSADAKTARAIFAHCRAAVAYYKAPGWILFADHIPVTGTQKIQKHRILPSGIDLATLDGMFDLRALKKRT